MEIESSNVEQNNKTQRNIFIRVLAAIFWLLLTILIVHMIVGGVVGGMSGSEVGAGKSIGDAYKAGAAAGQQASINFFNAHGGKVFLIELALWVGLLITGRYPWVSKYKQSKA